MKINNKNEYNREKAMITAVEAYFCIRNSWKCNMFHEKDALANELAHNNSIS